MIRGATKEDFETVKAYVQPLIKESVYGFVAEGYELTEDVYRYYYSTPLERLTLIFEEDNKPIGFVMFDSVIWPFPGFEIKCARIPFVFIEKKHRGKGHMNMAVDALEYWAKKINAQYCVLGTKNKKRGYKKAEEVYIKEVE